jgi:hypothetical protein
LTAHPNLFPVLVIQFECAQAVLDGHDEAVAWNKLLGERAAEVGALAEGNDGGEGVAVVLPAQGARVQRLLCALVIY